MSYTQMLILACENIDIQERLVDSECSVEICVPIASFKMCFTLLLGILIIGCCGKIAIGMNYLVCLEL